MTFDLRDAIDREVAANTSARPQDLATLIADLVPDDELREVLGSALRDTVRRRIASLNRVHSTDGASCDSWLDQRVAPGPKRWRRLRDCTRTELRDLARFHRRLASQHDVLARRYVALADAVAAISAASPDELPEEVVDRIRVA